MKKKKIFIGVFAISIIIILVCLLVIFKLKQQIKLADANTNNLQNVVHTEISENTIDENMIDINSTDVESIVSSNEIVENQDASIQPQEISKPQLAGINQKQTSVVNPVTEKSVETSIQQSQQKPNTQNQVNNKAQVQENTQEKTNIKNNNQLNTQTHTNVENTQQKQVPKNNVSTYVENTEIINRMTEVIENNETDDMKKYGYTIQPTSSIVDATSEFSFTKQRVKDKIKHKFGTIKIYARDYYINGVFQYTECFII